MKGFGDNKGITLAVLIVTIVVLLILAGITISNITGGDGILGQAQSKKDAATIQKEKDILGSAVMTASNKTKLGDLTEENLRDALSNKNVDIVKSGGLYKITFKDTNNLYKMNENGEYFYWENMQPTDIYAKLYTDDTLILSSYDYTDETRTLSYNYGKEEDWRSNKFKKIIIYDPIAPSTCGLMFYNCTLLENIENIQNLHTENAKNMVSMFYNCNNLKSIDLNYFDTSNVNDMHYMFRDCKSLKILNFNYWDTKNVTNLTCFLKGCTNLEKVFLNNFDTTNVQIMNAIFNNCHNLKTIDISSFKTSNVTSTTNMFHDCPELITIYVSKYFDITALSEANSSSMFYGCTKLVGGKGTKFSSSNNLKTYARIDNPPDEPGYFTLKQ